MTAFGKITLSVYEEAETNILVKKLLYGGKHHDDKNDVNDQRYLVFVLKCFAKGTRLALIVDPLVALLASYVKGPRI